MNETTSNQVASTGPALAGDVVDRLRRLVFDDPRLRERLLAVGDAEDFSGLLAGVARDRGIALTPADVRVLLRDARRRRIERW
jgi:hypothetical protein